MSILHKLSRFQKYSQVMTAKSRILSALQASNGRAKMLGLGWGVALAWSACVVQPTFAAQDNYYLNDPSSPVASQSVMSTAQPSALTIAQGPPANTSVAPDCNCATCAAKKAGVAPKTDKPKVDPCTTSHKGLFYDNDFKYLDDPNYQGCCLGDSLKNLGRCGNLDIGGQLRTRYHHEVGMGQQAGATRFQDTTNNFILTRYRLYADAKVSDRIRVYGEGIYAEAPSTNDAYVLRGIDRNRGDFLNLFVDVKMNDENKLRVGRQELLFGNQRLVSPLDWANTRRTFEGVRVLTRYENWSNDAFYTQLVPVQPQAFDTADADQEFYGTYSTFSGLENATVDLYYLGLHDTRAASDRTVNTFGSRLNGSKNKWLYELEGMAQTGNFLTTGQEINAYAATAGLGRNMTDVGWKPTLWFFYDYASGDSPGGDFTGFNSLFPLGHKYLGFIDAVDRTNISSPNVQLLMSPTKKLKLLTWYHNFTAAKADGNISSIGGTPAQDPTSKDFGNEIDFLATYNYNARTEVSAGYSHLWAGNKIINATDADFFYMQVQTNF